MSARPALRRLPCAIAAAAVAAALAAGPATAAVITMSPAPKVTEGDSGLASLTFKATYKREPGDDPGAPTLVYHPDGGSALGGVDYIDAWGTGRLSFGGLGVGESQTKTLTVHVVGDTAVEGNETVKISFWTGQPVAIVNPDVTGVIIDDDLQAPPLPPNPLNPPTPRPPGP